MGAPIRPRGLGSRRRQAATGSWGAASDRIRSGRPAAIEPSAKAIIAASARLIRAFIRIRPRITVSWTHTIGLQLDVVVISRFRRRSVSTWPWKHIGRRASL